MVKSTKPADKTEEEVEAERKKREELRKKEEQEKKEQERYLQRVRDMIKEDRKTNLEKAQIEIDGMIALQTVSLKEAQIRPLSLSKDRLESTISSTEFTVKIIYETRKQVHTLPEDATVEDFKRILKEQFSIKNPKAFISTVAEINFKDLSATLKSLGISDMDTIYVHSM